MSTNVGILIFVGMKNFMLSWVDHEKNAYLKINCHGMKTNLINVQR